MLINYNSRTHTSEHPSLKKDKTHLHGAVLN